MGTPLKVPVRFALSSYHWNDGTTVAMACPCCGFDYVHMSRVIVEQGSVSAECHSDQVFIGSHGVKGARGSRLFLSFTGECGHSFTYMLQFHKGQVFVHLDAIQRELDDDGIPVDKEPELWRD